MSSLKSKQDKEVFNKYLCINQFQEQETNKNISSKNIENPFTKKLKNIKKTDNKKIISKK